MNRIVFISLVLATLACPPADLGVSDEALEQRNLGIAQLENERPEDAAVTFSKLAELVADDPLPAANLAIAQLRQQKFAEAEAAIARALEIAPERADLLALRADVLQWSGRIEESLPVYAAAAELMPRDVELQFALFRQADTLGDDVAAARALERLIELRPDNLVVVLERGLAAIAAGDRESASAAYLRVRELLWQAPGAAIELEDAVLDALGRDDLAAARLPARQLENVLKVTPMYQQGLRELSRGIQGAPVLRFTDEPASDEFGPPVTVRFLAGEAPEGRGPFAVGDFDGDALPDIVRTAVGDGTSLILGLNNGESRSVGIEHAPSHLLAVDLDNDGALDLFAQSSSGATFLRGDGQGNLSPVDDLGLAGAAGRAAEALDFDIEGDLDLVVAGHPETPIEIYRNNLAGALEAVGSRALPDLGITDVRDILASDLDRDGDLDLLAAHAGGLLWLDNLRQGRFEDRTAAAGLDGVGAVRALASADLDQDGWPEIVAAGERLLILRNRQAEFTVEVVAEAPKGPRALALFDADNDGRLDLAVAGDGGLSVLTQSAGGGFVAVAVEAEAGEIDQLASTDWDGDGDLDLVAGSTSGLRVLRNEGGDQNHHLTVRLRGLATGSSKNNLLGRGSTVEVFAGTAYQFHEMTGDTLHVGLGGQAQADILRVVWTNGVPQNRLDVTSDQTIVEEQLLKGSCPFLYAWNGAEIAFVTDLLWGAPVGLPVAPGVWASADPQEIVLVEGAEPRAGRYDLRLTEELWEAAFFDFLRLWIVDHPDDVTVASSLKILPGHTVPERVHGVRELRPIVGAWDAAGREVSARLRLRDEVYAAGWRRSRYQGFAAEPWTLTFDLGEAPAASVRLVLDGWIFPSDASLNLAVAQRSDLPYLPPRLEVETAGGWQVLDDAIGFPAGKTKTMIVDTPALPRGARKLRIASNLWLAWDRIAWSTRPDDAAPRVVARLEPERADLDFRGFSALVRRGPDAPHAFDYARATVESPWLPFPGRYTRYGDVRELLQNADDRSVILGPGDEVLLEFDASHLAPPPPGWTRTVFLESHGWDKDADRNTYEGHRVEPLPFLAMSGYPYGADESFPDTALHRDYVANWLTRAVEARVGPAAR